MGELLWQGWVHRWLHNAAAWHWHGPTKRERRALQRQQVTLHRPSTILMHTTGVCVAGSSGLTRGSFEKYKSPNL